MNKTERLIMDTALLNRQHSFAGELGIMGLIFISTGLLMIMGTWEFFGMVWFALGMLFSAFGLIYTSRARETQQKIRYTYGSVEQ